MKLITAEQITAVINEIEGLELDKLNERVAKLTSLYPTLIGFLLSFEEEGELSDNDLNTLFYSGIILIEIMLKEGYTIPEIDPDELNEMYDEEFDTFMETVENSPENVDIDAIIEAHDQPFLLDFVYDVALSEEIEEEESFLYIRSALTTLVNTFHQKIA